MDKNIIKLAETLKALHKAKSEAENELKLLSNDIERTMNELTRRMTKAK